jgi:hypothetical protein
MQEKEILDALESVAQSFYSNEEKALIFAHVLDEKTNIKTAKSLNRIVLEKIAEYSKGDLREAQNTAPKMFQDFSEIEEYPKPFEMINKKEIDAFLDKMTSNKFEGNFFDDTFGFVHPVETMEAEGVARHRSDFNVSNIA